MYCTEPPRCRACGRIIKFIETKNGKWMPVDGFPVRCYPDENGVLLYNGDGTSFRGHIVDKTVTNAVYAFEPHFATCPKAGEIQRSRPAPRQARDTAFEKAKAEAEKARREEEQKRAEKRAVEEREREWRERQTSLFREPK